MFWSIFRFELNFHRRQPMFYVVSLVFFLLSFGATVSDNITVGGVADNININSPFNIVVTLGVWSFIAMFGCVAYAASPVLRDFEFKVAELFLTTRIKKFDYLIARFSGAFMFCLWIFAMALLGMLIGEFMPWLDPERIGPTRLDAYWFATWAVGIPNLLFVSTLVFFIATLTRSLMASYVGVIALLIANGIISSLVDPEQIRLLSMLDPFGMEAIAAETRYWTPYQSNEQIVSFSGNLLLNRVIVLGLFLLITFGAYRLFRFSVEGMQKPRWLTLKRKRKSQSAAAKTDEKTFDFNTLLPIATKPIDRQFNFTAHLKQFISIATIETKNIIFGKTFVVFLLLGLLLVVINALLGISAIFGTDLYPTTTALVGIINGSYSLPLLIVLVFYASELLSRDKAVHMSEIIDSMPYPNWVVMSAKLVGLVVVVACMLLAAIVAGVGVQVFSGFFDINIPHYFAGLFLFFQFPLWLTCVFALFFQVITGNRYVGMLFAVLYLIGIMFIPNTGFDQFLYIPNIPSAIHSDFFGYDQGLDRYIAFSIYWGFFVGLLLVAIQLFWQRGTEAVSRFRWTSIRQRLTPRMLAFAGVCLIGFIATGAFNFYNTNVLNEHLSRIDRETRQADYEKQYKQYEDLRQPDVTDIYVEVDIYPERKEAHAKGYYLLTNNSNDPINELHLTLQPNLTFEEINLPSSEQTFHDDKLGYTIYQLQPPLAAGETRKLEFVVDWLTPGFANNIPTNRLLSNGTFFDNTELLPLIGYSSGAELNDNNRRRKYDLEPIERMRKIDDRDAWQTAQLGTGYRTHYEAIVSTSSDQIAVTPGYLVKEWQDNNRRYFHYKMDDPIWPFVSFLSADYQVAKSKWQDIDIEVYYHHDYNVQRMLEASEKSLAYFSDNFSPYQYRQYRIFEFPRPIGTFAQSFPNTIPFSEGIGFVADITDPEDIDYVFYVTAHELAHQWWAHQVIGANVQGATVLTETLSQYSALMIMEQEYGQDVMQRFLRYELDNYLNSRGGELIEELPLLLVENQPYIHYRKGSVVLYALKDYLGEEVVNSVLKDFIKDWGFQGPPFPTTKDLVAAFREAAEPEHQDTITDLFEKIVVYDLKVTDGEYREVGDEQFEVTFTVNANKFEADGKGKEEPVAIAGLIDIAVLGEEQGERKIPEVLYLQKHPITEAEQSFTIVVNKAPKKVGIDPYNKLIDKNPEDNRKTINKASGRPEQVSSL